MMMMTMMMIITMVMMITMVMIIVKRQQLVKSFFFCDGLTCSIMYWQMNNYIFYKLTG